MTKSLFNLITIQIKEFIRDPEVLFWGLAFPVALAWILGIAFSSQEHLTRPVGVVLSQTQADQPLQRWMDRVQASAREASSPSSLPMHFKFIYLPSAAEAMTAIKRGRFSLYVDAGSSGPRFHFDP